MFYVLTGYSKGKTVTTKQGKTVEPAKVVGFCLPSNVFSQAMVQVSNINKQSMQSGEAMEKAVAATEVAYINRAKRPFSCLENQLIGQIVKDHSAVLVNFGIEGSGRKMKLSGEKGAFSRLANKPNADGTVAPTAVVIASRISRDTGEVVGYYVARIVGGNAELGIMNCKSLYSICATYRSNNLVFLQNAIFKVVDNKPFISCYKPYKSAVKTEDGKVEGKDIPFYPVVTKLSKAQSKASTVRKDVKAKNARMLKDIVKNYSPEQQEIIFEAQRAGLKKAEVVAIANKNFSPEQMSNLVDLAKKGVPVAFVAQPKFTPDTMEYLSVFLTSPKEARKYSGMLRKPGQYTADQLSEIRQGITDGVDYNLYNDPVNRAGEMCAIRTMLDTQIYSYDYGDTLPKEDNKKKATSRCINNSVIVRLKPGVESLSEEERIFMEPQDLYDYIYLDDGKQIFDELCTALHVTAGE